MASVLYSVCIFQGDFEKEEVHSTFDSCSFSFPLAFEKCLFQAAFIKILIFQFAPFLSDVQRIKV